MDENVKRGVQQYALKRVQSVLIMGGLLLLLSGGSLLLPSFQAWGQTNVILVNSTGDQADADITDGVCVTAVGSCTLRAAIMEANAQSGADQIRFNISGTGVQSIAIGSALPALMDSTGGTILNGYSQPGAAVNDNIYASTATILIELRGNGANGFDGLTLTSGDNVIRGVAIYNFARAIVLSGADATNNRIVGSFIGTDAVGSFNAQSAVAGASGLLINGGASNNQIGAANLPDRNVISGNAGNGITITGDDTSGNVLHNNIVGPKMDGLTGRPNLGHGLAIGPGALQTTVGGTAVFERNVFSANAQNGIEIAHGAADADVRIHGNSIGTELAGVRIRNWTPNTTGIAIVNGSSGDSIADNVISGNAEDGILLEEDSTNVVVRDNQIGAGADGYITANTRYGVNVRGSGNQIGPGNVIAFNKQGAIVVDGVDADNNLITQNHIYSNGGLGIDLMPVGVNVNDSGDVDGGANQGLNFPVLTRVERLLVAGTACADCTVELFRADVGVGNNGMGSEYLATAVADASGAFTATLTTPIYGNYVTATASDSAGNSSEFAANVAVSEPPLNGTGLAYEYYEYEGDLEFLPLFSELTPVETGIVGDFDLAVRLQGDRFALRFDTCFSVPAAGTYTFYTLSDDGSQLYVNNELVVDNDGARPLYENSGDITLSAGSHHVTTLFFEQGGYEVLEVSYKAPNGTRVPLPPEQLSVNDCEQEPLEQVLGLSQPEPTATPSGQGASSTLYLPIVAEQ